jgi:hypothetical protein
MTDNSADGKAILTSAQAMVIGACLSGLDHHKGDQRSALAYALTSLLTAVCYLGQLSADPADDAKALEFIKARLDRLWPVMRSKETFTFTSGGGDA